MGSSWIREGVALWVTFLSKPSPSKVQSSLWILPFNHPRCSEIYSLCQTYTHYLFIPAIHSLINSLTHSYIHNSLVYSTEILCVVYCGDREERGVGSEFWNLGLAALSEGTGQTQLPFPVPPTSLVALKLSASKTLMSSWVTCDLVKLGDSGSVAMCEAYHAGFRTNSQVRPILLVLRPHSE